MKVKTKLSPLVLATSVALTGMAVPVASQAEMSATFAASNMYLWRGLNLSPDGGFISGSLDYSMGGLYAGVWTGSESGGHETDLYLGYGGEISGFTYDISYVRYLYPEDVNDDGEDGLGDTDAAEAILKLGYGGFGFGYYRQVDSDLDDDVYMTLSYDYEAFGVTYGLWQYDNDDVDGYTHLTFTYAPIDSLTFAVSKVLDQGDTEVEEDPLFQVTYSLGFDL